MIDNTSRLDFFTKEFKNIVSIQGNDHEMTYKLFTALLMNIAMSAMQEKEQRTDFEMASVPLKYHLLIINYDEAMESLQQPDLDVFAAVNTELQTIRKIFEQESSMPVIALSDIDDSRFLGVTTSSSEDISELAADFVELVPIAGQAIAENARAVSLEDVRLELQIEGEDNVSMVRHDAVVAGTFSKLNINTDFEKSVTKSFATTKATKMLELMLDGEAPLSHEMLSVLYKNFALQEMLLIAVQKNNFTAVQTMLEAGISESVTDKNGLNAMHYAA